MNETTRRALDSAAASSAMEGLPLSDKQRHIVEAILNKEMSLQEYLTSLQKMQEA